MPPNKALQPTSTTRPGKLANCGARTSFQFIRSFIGSKATSSRSEASEVGEVYDSRPISPLSLPPSRCQILTGKDLSDGVLVHRAGHSAGRDAVQHGRILGRVRGGILAGCRRLEDL